MEKKNIFKVVKKGFGYQVTILNDDTLPKLARTLSGSIMKHWLNCGIIKNLENNPHALKVYQMYLTYLFLENHPEEDMERLNIIRFRDETFYTNIFEGDSKLYATHDMYSIGGSIYTEEMFRKCIQNSKKYYGKEIRTFIFFKHLIKEPARKLFHSDVLYRYRWK